MVRGINQANFSGGPKVTCYTCHRGVQEPEVIPNLAQQYGVPLPDDPNTVDVKEAAPNQPSADQVFDQYVQAVGGAQAGSLLSYTGKGTYEGYDTDRVPLPVEFFAKAPDQRATVVHMQDGDKVMAFDGHDAWIAEPETPAPLLQLGDGDLDAAKISAMLSFPRSIKDVRSQWLVGTTTIDDHEVRIVQGTGAGKTPLKLYFDKDSGLLVRMVSYANTVVGMVPTQVDYKDYRAVGRVKLPYQWTVTWVDGRSTTQLTEIQANAPINVARFAKPTIPAKPSGR